MNYVIKSYRFIPLTLLMEYRYHIKISSELMEPQFMSLNHPLIFRLEKLYHRSCYDIQIKTRKYLR